MTHVKAVTVECLKAEFSLLVSALKPSQGILRSAEGKRAGHFWHSLTEGGFRVMFLLKIEHNLSKLASMSVHTYFIGRSNRIKE